MSKTPNKPPKEFLSNKEFEQQGLKKIRFLCRGNGVEPDSVQIKNTKTKIVQCPAITHIELHPEVTQEQKVGQYQAGQVLESASLFDKTIQDYTIEALKNSKTREFLANTLLKRSDKGFAIHGEFFDVAPLKTEYCAHEACGTCNGAARTECRTCRGQKREVCSQCHGRTMTSCQYCHGNGFQQGPDGQQKQCTRCFGARQIPCTICQKAGTIPCRQCKGSGDTKCNACDGKACITHIAHLKIKMKTLFEFDRTEVPRPVVRLIENGTKNIIERQHIKLKNAEQVKREDGGLAIQYDAEFPYSEMELSINGKIIKAHLFGYNTKLLDLPDFLDNLVEPNLQLLQEAANGQGPIATKIRKAANSRLIAEGVLLAVSMPPKKAMLALKKKFPLGASNNMLKNVVLNANKALSNVTRKTRYSGIGAGIGLAALIDALYLFTSLRLTISNLLGSGTILIDVTLIILGGFAANKIATYMAQRPLQKALGKLMPQKQRSRFKPRTHNNKYISYLLSGLTFIVISFIVNLLGGQTPSWLPF